MPRRHVQPDAPRLPLRTSEQLKAELRNSEQPEPVCGKAEQMAAELLDDAIVRACLTNKEIAHLCGVSVSLVEKWRSTDARGCPSFVQMLLLPPVFHLSLHKAMNARFGFARAAVLELIDAAGTLAVLTK